MVSSFMDALQGDGRVQEERGDGMIDVFIPLLAGVLIGANVGFVIAELFGGNHDEDLPD